MRAVDLAIYADALQGEAASLAARSERVCVDREVDRAHGTRLRARV